MTEQEQKLINAIKARPGHEVTISSHECSIHVVRASKYRVSQLSVWLGRRNTIEHLEQIAAADKVIVHMGDTWRVLSIGAKRDGNTFCHLASTHLKREEGLCYVPVQINDWVDTAVLAAAK